jgi:hypothetical protein
MLMKERGDPMQGIERIYRGYGVRPPWAGGYITEPLTVKGMDYSQIAYKLAAIRESIDTPDQARDLSQDVYSGIRIILEETSELLLDIFDSQGFKLLAVATLMETPEQAEQIGVDVWSGARLIIEDVSEYLLNV